jgi:hypothetical protein
VRALEEGMELGGAGARENRRLLACVPARVRLVTIGTRRLAGSLSCQPPLLSPLARSAGGRGPFPPGRSMRRRRPSQEFVHLVVVWKATSFSSGGRSRDPGTRKWSSATVRGRRCARRWGSGRRGREG